MALDDLGGLGGFGWLKWRPYSSQKSLKGAVFFPLPVSQPEILRHIVA